MSQENIDGLQIFKKVSLININQVKQHINILLKLADIWHYLALPAV